MFSKVNNDIFCPYYFLALWKSWLKLKFLKLEKQSVKDWSCSNTVKDLVGDLPPTEH